MNVTSCYDDSGFVGSVSFSVSTVISLRLHSIVLNSQNEHFPNEI